MQAVNKIALMKYIAGFVAFKVKHNLVGQLVKQTRSTKRTVTKKMRKSCTVTDNSFEFHCQAMYCILWIT